MRQAIEQVIANLDQGRALEDLSAKDHEITLLTQQLENQELEIQAFAKLNANRVIRGLIALFNQRQIHA